VDVAEQMIRNGHMLPKILEVQQQRKSETKDHERIFSDLLPLKEENEEKQQEGLIDRFYAAIGDEPDEGKGKRQETKQCPHRLPRRNFPDRIHARSIQGSPKTEIIRSI